MAGAVAAQWSMSSTAGGLLQFTTDLITAATTDNVQPTVLQACEALGAKLAMSETTIEKMSQLCNKPHQNQVLEHLKLQVGYMKGDSGWQLAQSVAGLRFLGLAACLLTVTEGDHRSVWPRAEVLQALIRDASFANIPMPTTRHLADLLLCLDYYLQNSRFSNWVAGSYDLIREGSRHLDIHDNMRIFPRISTPSSQGIRMFIKTIWSIGRLGDAGLSRIEVDVGVDYAPWIMAVTRWCLGELPTVYSGATTCLKTESPITISVLPPSTSNKPFQIRVIDQLENITDVIVDDQARHAFVGMLPVKAVVDRFNRSITLFFGSTDSPGWRHAVSTLSYGCHQVSELVRENTGKSLLPSRYKLPSPIHVAGPSIVPSDEDLTSVLANFLGTRFQVQLWGVLPITPTNVIDRLSKYNENQTYQLERHMKHYIAFMFVLSLLESTPDLSEVLVGDYYTTNMSPSALIQDFDRGMLDELLNRCVDLGIAGLGQPVSLSQRHSDSVRQMKGKGWIITPVDMFNSARKSLGHTAWRHYLTQEGTHMVAMSSSHGQTIFLEALHTKSISSARTMKMVCVPGLILWEGEKYEKLFPHTDKSPTFEQACEYDIYDIADDQTPETPFDGFAGIQARFAVYSKQDGLYLGLSLEGNEKLMDPVAFISSPDSHVFVNCNHDRYSKLFSSQSVTTDCLLFEGILDIRAEILNEQDMKITKISKSDSYDLARETGGVRVFSSDNNDQMRYCLTALHYENAVVREHACVMCCIRACLAMKRHVLIC